MDALCLTGGWAEFGDGKRSAKMDLCRACGMKRPFVQRMLDGTRLIDTWSRVIVTSNGGHDTELLPRTAHVTDSTVFMGSREIYGTMPAIDRTRLTSLDWIWSDADGLWALKE